MPAIGGMTAVAFLMLWIAGVGAALFLLGLIGHAVETLLRWHERQDAKRPIARGAHFPKPVLIDEWRGRGDA